MNLRQIPSRRSLSFQKDTDKYWAAPVERRRPLLELLHSYNVRYIFAGHIHKNSIAKDGELEIIGTGPVGKPVNEEASGIRMASATAEGIQHRYYEFGKMPDKLEIK
jgi:hypothetical protein